MIFLQVESKAWSDFLSNSSWQGIGVILGSLIGILAIYVAIVQLILKRLSYKIITNSKLISQLDSIKDNIKILYNDVEVKDVNFIEVKISNTGNKSIEIADFAEPIKIQLNNESKILQLNITKRNPENLKIETTINGNSILISPTLLNKKDNFHLEIIATNYIELKLESRIKDIDKIHNESIDVKASNFIKKATNYLAFSAIAVMILSFIIGLIFDIDISKVIVFYCIPALLLAFILSKLRF